MRIGAGAATSRLVFATPVGVKFTVTADLAEAGISRPRYGYPAGQNHPRHDVHHENQSEKHQPRGPGLAMPVFVWRKGIVVNYQRERRRRLAQPRAPKTVAESRKKQRCGFPRHACER